MNNFRVVLLFFSTVGATYVHAVPAILSNNEESNIVNVWLNGVDRNVETVLLTSENGDYIECRTLDELGVSSVKFIKYNNKEEFCLLKNTDISFEKDDGLQAIKINLSPVYFSEKFYGNVVTKPQKANFGGFINYDFFYSKDDYSDDFNTLAEIGFFKDYWLLDNSFIYRSSPDEGEKNVLRLSSYFEMDMPEKYLKFRAGDNTTNYNALTNSFRFGGLSFGTNYTERPDFVYWNMPTLNGSAALPSTVDLMLNGVSLYKQAITPGKYSLQTGASIDQGGEATIVVEDVLGNRSVQSFPIYISNKLLSVGLNEYDISLGKLRYNYDEDDTDYREFFSKLYYRRGLSRSTTMGFDATYSDDIKILNLMWTQGVSKYFILDTEYAVSDYNGEVGYGVSGSVSRSFKDWSFGLNSRYYTEEFKQLGFEEYSINTKYSNLAYLNFSNLKFIDSLSLSYVDNVNYNKDGFEQEDSQIVNVGVQKRLTNNLYTTVNYYKDFKQHDNSFNIMLSYSWGNVNRVNLEHDTDRNESLLSYTRNSINQTGLDYSLAVGRSDGEMNYHAFGLYKTNVGDLSASYDEYDNLRLVQAQYNGALVWLGNKAAFTKYVDNAFALVSLSGMENVDVMKSLSVVGKTNKDGYAFVHNVIPYINYDISFDQDQLPLDYSFDQTTKKINALDKRGYIVDFNVAPTKKFIVHLKNINNQNFPLGTVVNVNNDEGYFVDSDGLFYVYLSQKTNYNLHVLTKEGKTCSASLSVTQNQINTAESSIIELVCR
ncbi:fimbria/pilus outer membrane usher protein [Acinetobacter sp. YH01005]|uniref:fimbria/pilus outer membrane usher protein n=1 Tax=Acinetobacter sp. YH01005 TaxID=2601021 RepID=UPI0015D36724|nr:fimbria/pilus outer membrane usher protein [Acinetobacter sp. YH01005]